jgi:hypothetical protein
VDVRVKNGDTVRFRKGYFAAGGPQEGFRPFQKPNEEQP